MWIQQPINYNRHALWGVSHWGRKRQQFYGYAVNRESALDVYSKRRIIAVTELKIVEWHDYKHLDWISEHCHPEASGRSLTGSGVAAAVVAWYGGGTEKGRVRESGVDERVDRVTGTLFGFAGKIPPEKFSGGGRRRRRVAGWWPPVGGDGEWGEKY
nr:hypothetical protein [Tanacetum cinerariifolium]